MEADGSGESNNISLELQSLRAEEESWKREAAKAEEEATALRERLAALRVQNESALQRVAILKRRKSKAQVTRQALGAEEAETRLEVRAQRQAAAEALLKEVGKTIAAYALEVDKLKAQAALAPVKSKDEIDGMVKRLFVKSRPVPEQAKLSGAPRKWTQKNREWQAVERDSAKKPLAVPAMNEHLERLYRRPVKRLLEAGVKRADEAEAMTAGDKGGGRAGMGHAETDALLRRLVDAPLNARKAEMERLRRRLDAEMGLRGPEHDDNAAPHVTEQRPRSASAGAARRGGGRGGRGARECGVGADVGGETEEELKVTVPECVSAGDDIVVELPDGRSYEVTVPAECRVGDEFIVAVPRQPA